MKTIRSVNETFHSQRLAQNNPEKIWGWSTPAGRIRAVRRAEMIASGGQLMPGKYALEIGCGTGMFTEMFAETGARLIAVDISADLLEIAWRRRLAKESVLFLEKRFEDCNVDGPFDAVIGSSVLHHLDLEASLSRIYDLLKPGGFMSFTEPNMLNPQIMMQKNIPLIKKRLGDSPDETAFVRWVFYKELLKAGFAEIEIVPFDWLHPATPEKLIHAVSRIGRILESIPIVREFSGSLFIRCKRPKEPPHN
jgi:2-polyprenyl-3-methyl-5-hydroxy-6-metoxy-1,4-benzoquinol methylase